MSFSVSMLYIFVGINIFLTIYLLVRFVNLLSSNKLNDKIKKEISSVIIEFNNAADRNISLIEDRIKNLDNLIKTADERTHLLDKLLKSTPNPLSMLSYFKHSPHNQNPNQQLTDTIENIEHSKLEYEKEITIPSKLNGIQKAYSNDIQKNTNVQKRIEIPETKIKMPETNKTKKELEISAMKLIQEKSEIFEVMKGKDLINSLKNEVEERNDAPEIDKNNNIVEFDKEDDIISKKALALKLLNQGKTIEEVISKLNMSFSEIKLIKAMQKND